MEQPSVTTQTPPPAPRKQLHGFHYLLLSILFVILGFSGAGAYFYYHPLREKIVEKPVEVKHELKIPSDAVKLSECVPAMGEHWVELKNLPRGPFYVSHNGKVIGMEFMFRLKDIPGNELAHMSLQQSQKYIADNKLSFRDLLKIAIPDHIEWPQYMDIKTWDIEWAPPHVGLLEPHYDIHFWNISKEELNQVCPDAPFGSELPPNMATELKKLGVPVP